jgi:hypothetical protein
MRGFKMKNSFKCIALVLAMLTASSSFGMGKIQTLRQNAKAFINNHSMVKGALVASATLIPLFVIPALLWKYQTRGNVWTTGAPDPAVLNNVRPSTGFNNLAGAFGGLVIGTLANKYPNLATDVALAATAGILVAGAAVTSLCAYEGARLLLSAMN